MAVTSIRVRVHAFARMREVLGRDDFEVDLPAGSRIADLAALLRARNAESPPLLAVTKFARNGKLAMENDELEDGDDVALLPPVGGG